MFTNISVIANAQELKPPTVLETDAFLLRNCATHLEPTTKTVLTNLGIACNSPGLCNRLFQAVFIVDLRLTVDVIKLSLRQIFIFHHLLLKT